ncbi:M56 family metallopeptidase [Amycolatopsis sp. CA-126428]|uniref:M56 family metallopeptidase n=1 Tax=Amycolatopsis sp. CA-126428 TaxID=2073158 RepID=UPI000CD2B9A8|nr:M56 family metallopeptidase [Amycolatopsis sp. CA-126428]
MIPAAALLLGVVLVAWWSPHPLSRLTAAGAAPGTAIAWWLLTATGVIAGAIGGVVLLVLPDHGPATAIMRVLHGCWSAVGHGGLPSLDPIVATAAGAVVLGVGGRLALASARRRQRRNLLHRRHLEAPRLSGTTTSRPVPTLWLAENEPIAYSLGGRRALIVASTGLKDRLSDAELRAVLAHERAHVHGRHHLLTAVAEVLGRTLRFLPLMRELPGAVRLLVELSADRTAAGRCGPEPLGSALRSIRAAGGPRRALAMSGGDTAIRLHWLTTAPEPRSRFATRLTAVAVGGLALLAPPTVAAGLVVGTGLISCP